MSTDDTLAPLPRRHPPRPEQVGLALAMLIGTNQRWEQNGEWDRRDGATSPLYAYLQGMCPGQVNPLGAMRENHEYQARITDAADILRHPYAGSAS